MKLKKHISFKSDKQVWRLLLNEKDDLLIESRDTSTKEVSYFIINIPHNKVILKEISLPDNIWLGVESFFGDYIFFHKFIKPDLPMHMGIITYNILTNSIIWQNFDYTFFLVDNDSLIAQKKGFDENFLFRLNLQTGEFIENLSLTFDEIDELHNNFMSKYNYNLYNYPDDISLSDDDLISDIINKYTKKFPLKYNPRLLIYEELYLCNFHLLTNKGISNYFVAVDSKSGKVKEEIILNTDVKSYIPESFFTYKNFLILLKEKNEVLIYKME